MMMRLHSPGVTIRIRIAPTFESEDIGILEDGDEVRVDHEVNGFYQLSDGRGYVIAHDCDIEWIRQDVKQGQADSVETDDQMIDQSSPKYSSDIWMISCRPPGSLNAFSEKSLIFQPDIRLFCHKGSECRISHPDHAARYCHTLPSHPTEEESAKSPQNPFGIPRVKRTWTLLDDRFISESNESLDRPAESPNDHSESLPTNSRVIVYVHGHRTRFYRITAVLDHLKNIVSTLPFSSLSSSSTAGAALTSMADDTSATCTHGSTQTTTSVKVIGFLWPCHSRKLSYSRALQKTQLAGALLAGALRALRAQGNEVVAVVAHSMGARVAAHALLHFSSSSSSPFPRSESCPTPPSTSTQGGDDEKEEDEEDDEDDDEECQGVQTRIAEEELRMKRAAAIAEGEAAGGGAGFLCGCLLLVAAALPSDAFVTDFPLGSLRSTRIVNIHSVHDDTLSSGFRSGEAMDRILSGGGLVSVWGALRAWSSSTAGAMGLGGAVVPPSMTSSHAPLPSPSPSPSPSVSSPLPLCTESSSAVGGRRSNHPNLVDGAADVVKLYNVDVSSEVRGHSVHAYFAATAFATELAKGFRMPVP